MKKLIIMMAVAFVSFSMFSVGEANAKPSKSKQYHYSQTNKKVGNKKAKKAKAKTEKPTAKKAPAKKAAKKKTEE